MAAEFVAEAQRAFEVDRTAGAQSPRVEHASVSADASTENAPGSTATTVRQGPEQAIEARAQSPRSEGGGDRQLQPDIAAQPAAPGRDR